MVQQAFRNQPSMQMIKQAVQDCRVDHKIDRAFVFGSYARGEARPESDVDVAVEMLPDADLLDLAGFKQELETRLGLEVDVTTRRSISPKLRAIIERDLVAV